MACTTQRLVKLISFYIIYYGLLTLLFFLSLKLMTKSPEHNLTPTRQAHLSSPYMTVQPISHIAEYTSRSERKNKIKLPLTKTGDKWSDADYYSGLGMVDFMGKYLKDFEGDAEDRSCSSEGKAALNGQLNSLSGDKYGCKPYANYTWIKSDTNCGTNFGLDTLNPCFIVSLNRIVNWELLGLTNTTFQELKTDGMETGISDWVFDIPEIDGKHAHFSCFEFADNVNKPGMPDYNKPLREDGETTAEIQWIEESFNVKDEDSQATKDEVEVRGDYNTIPSYFFPFTGKTSDYAKTLGLTKKPFIVMQLKFKPSKYAEIKNTNGKAVSHFECNAYGENIISSYLVKETVDGVDNFNLKWKDGVKRNGQFSQFSFGVEWSV